jgi:alkaline phosphatase
MKKNPIFLWAMIVALFFSFGAIFTACNDEKENEELNTVTDYKTPKYIFYFIGDGMSSPQINVTEAALNDPEFSLKSTSNVGIGELNLRKLTVTGMQTTHAEDRYITGSAASATALATGHKTTINTISKSGDHAKNLKTMAEMAKEKGMKIGIISSVSIDHATPACFYAHNNDRGNYQEIGQDLINSGFDYFAGGSVRHNKYDDYTIADFVSDAESKGYKYVNKKADFDALNEESGKVIATLEKFYTNTSDGCALPYIIDLDAQTSENDKITLSDFTKKGIEVLDNEDGFFMMVEGGKIDWACHANDVVSAAHNTVEFDKAIQYAIDFYNEHPEETLIVLTGDHECGGLTLGFAATAYESAFEVLRYQKESYVEFTSKVVQWASAGDFTFDDALEEAKKSFGLGDASLNPALALSDYEKALLKDAFERSMKGESTHEPEEVSVIYGYYDPFTVTITHILNNKAGIDWTSYSHTGVPVPVFALGQGQYEFNGYYDNTDIGKKIIDIAKLKE